MSLVTVEDLARKMRGTLDPEAAALACEAASAIAQNITGQTLEVADHLSTIEIDVATRRPPRSGSPLPPADWGRVLGVVKLPQRPVRSVTEVMIDGVPIDEGAQWWWDGAVTLWIGDTDGVAATVGYSAGYDPIPADLRAVVLNIAASEYAVTSEAIASERLADYQVSYRASDDAAVTARQRVLLSRYSPSVTTIRLG